MKTALIPIEEARGRILSRIKLLDECAQYSLEHALKKVLADDVYATIDVPPCDNSAMDGIVINYDDYQGLASKSLKVETIISAGNVPENLSSACAARIFTGAMLPLNGDTVIPIEECRFYVDEKSRQEYVDILVEPLKKNHVRPKGQDVRKGQKVFSKGQRLKPQDLALLASLGLSEVPCRKTIKVGVVSTGDELLKPGEANEEGKIYNSNQYMLMALLQELGVEVKMFDVLADELEKTKSALFDISQQCDCIISTGGVSVGGADFVKQALEAIGEMDLWRLAIKPGKPFTFGLIEGKPFFGLPGNPVAVFVTFSFLVKPALFRMLGVPESRHYQVYLPAGFSLKANKKRQEYLRVSVENQHLTLFDNQSSGVLSSLSYSDGLAIVPIGVDVKEGDLLHFIPYAELNV